MIVTRFAPSPTGLLHIGHAFGAFFAFEAARQAGGRFLLRIEDIDPARCRPAYTDAIFEDLRWLGLVWEEPVRRQSEHGADYEKALDRLRAMKLLYPCFCTRAEIAREAAASGHAPHAEDEGPVYPGTCRALTEAQREELASQRPFVWRIDMEKAARMAGPLVWRDREAGEIAANPARFGDVVLARKDVPTCYHLSVTTDDALQDVSLVTRGKDLFGATDIHVMLQKLLDLPTPEYWHHMLLCGADGKKFSKRDEAVTLRALREEGMSPGEVKRLFTA